MSKKIMMLLSIVEIDKGKKLIKELKKICFSFVYLLFIWLLLFSWHENFCGVTTKEISGSHPSVKGSFGSTRKHRLRIL